MNIFKTLAAGLSGLLCVASASASDFFSKEAPSRMLNLGVHVGVNTSNRTVGDGVFSAYNHNSWGTGFDAGITADLNIRDYISIQPGFFFQSRSGDYCYVDETAMYYIPSPDASGLSSTYKDTQVGHIRSYHFDIPIMVALHFNVTPMVRWNVEAGPYVSFKLHSNEGDRISVEGYSPTGDLRDYYLNAKGVDFGVKMGTSLTIRNHYNVGAHYQAGCLDAWKESWMKGRNKAWTFTLGYIF